MCLGDGCVQTSEAKEEESKGEGKQRRKGFSWEPSADPRAFRLCRRGYTQVVQERWGEIYIIPYRLSTGLRENLTENMNVKVFFWAAHFRWKDCLGILVQPLSVTWDPTTVPVKKYSLHDYSFICTMRRCSCDNTTNRFPETQQWCCLHLSLSFLVQKLTNIP